VMHIMVCSSRKHCMIGVPRIQALGLAATQIVHCNRQQICRRFTAPPISHNQPALPKHQDELAMPLLKIPSPFPSSMHVPDSLSSNVGMKLLERFLLLLSMHLVF
jgi:hypothetical protein